MATQLIRTDITSACGHTVSRLIVPGTLETLQTVARRYLCNACKANRVEPVRFKTGWGRTR